MGDGEKVRHGGEMHVNGELFSLRFTAENQVELFVEDDGFYHFKVRFSRDWLRDLSNVAAAGSKYLVDVVGTPRT